MDKLKNKIDLYSKKLWYPYRVKKKQLDINSWSNATIGYNSKKQNTENYQFNIQKLVKPKYYCKQIILLPTKRQKEILLNWMDIYSKMYNETLKVIKKEFYEHKKINLDFKNIRSNYMLKKKEYLHSISGIPTEKNNTKINKHILDCAIKDVCSSYKSAFKNLKNSNIKHFRIRYIKQSKHQKFLKIEKLLFSKDRKTFCKSILGNSIQTTNNINFIEVEHDCNLLYNSINQQFTLFVPINVKDNKIEKHNKRDTIGLDPGIRTFMTGYSKNNILEIGNNLTSKVSKQLKNIDSINKKKIKNVRIVENKKYTKINNLIDDLHWKTINYLTNNYDTILIGNMSTKKIVSKTNNLYKMTKRIALIMKLNKFTTRLKYKCSIKNCNFGIVNEMYTSKTCSYCGNINNNLGSSKIYHCDYCKNKIGRDINGARNIFLLGLK
mgnify:CR=1 FL=1